MNINKTLLAAVVVTGLGAVTTNAHAQGTPTAQVAKPITIKIGGLFPGDGDTKDALQNLFSISGTYDFGKTVATTPLVYSAYVDLFLPRTHSKDGVDFKGESYALGAQARYLFTSPGSAASFVPYGGLGLGVYHTRVKASVPGTSISKDATGIGGKAFIGAELKSGFLGEIGYDFIPKVGGGFDAKLSGFDARLGYRF